MEECHRTPVIAQKPPCFGIMFTAQDPVCKQVCDISLRCMQRQVENGKTEG